ncbi:hypothetical protein D5R81_13265 [Parashewanella spongiae]|uniref:Uncharacterized protein n=2 Tax=Parashewanella spongiae TaxID=342950 RepID=A0A3A6TKG1_9GAMM|nr:hypothetical protein [Parashewanella spongiae]RJY11419.1 hypothetical protein D5R81_13265 [Parashewanella spongiae]
MSAGCAFSPTLAHKFFEHGNSVSRLTDETMFNGSHGIACSKDGCVYRVYLDKSLYVNRFFEIDVVSFKQVHQSRLTGGALEQVFLVTDKHRSLTTQALIQFHQIFNCSYLSIGGYKVDLSLVSEGLRLGNIKHEQDLDDIKLKLEKHFRRRPLESRYEMMLNTNNNSVYQAYESQFSSLTNLFETLGLLSKLQPPMCDYQNILVLGSTVQNMRQRLESLKQQEICYENVFILVGNRKLYQSERSFIDERSALKHCNAACDTESDAASWLIKHQGYGFFFPNIKVITAENTYENGKERTANTGDTIKAFLKLKADTTNTLVVSTQPFGIYQCQYAKNEFMEAGRDPDINVLADVPLVSATEQEKIKIYFNTLDSIFRVHRSEKSH